MSQTAYAITQGAPFAGVLADQQPNVIRSFTNKEATAALPFGVFVTRSGVLGDGAILLAAAGDTMKPLGVTVHRHSVNTIGSAAWSAAGGIPAGDRFDLLQRGSAWIVAETAIAVTDALLLRWQANGAGKLVIGALRVGADTGAAACPIAGIRVVEPCAAAGVVLVEFDLMVLMASNTAAGFLPKF